MSDPDPYRRWHAARYGADVPINAVRIRPLKTYSVPTQLSLLGIIALMTLFSVLFGILRYSNAHPAFYAFFGIEAFAVCLAQMIGRTSPRFASALTGALGLPATVMISWAVETGARLPRNTFGPSAFIFGTCSLGFLILGGVLVGYMTGTIAAGVFLLVDAFERWYLPPSAMSTTTVQAELIESDVITASLADTPPEDSTTRPPILGRREP